MYFNRPAGGSVGVLVSIVCVRRKKGGGTIEFDEGEKREREKEGTHNLNDSCIVTATSDDISMV